MPSHKDEGGAMEHTYQVVLEPAEEGGLVVFVLGMPGCASQGETEEEALDNIRDAIQCWFEGWEQVEREERAKGNLLRTIVVSC